MIFERTEDMDLVKEILTTDGIWEMIGGHRLKKEEYEPDDTWLHVVGRDGDKTIALFMIHDTPAGHKQIHIQIIPEYRKEYREECGAKGMEWIWENTDFDVLVASVPSLYPRARAHAEQYGFELFRTLENSYEKDGTIYDKWLMSIKR